MKEKVKYDDDVIAQIDKDMGWVKKGRSPSKTAKDLGYHCQFLGTGTAWYGKNKVWSHSILSGNCTTLLAKSFSELERLYNKNKERPVTEEWKKYYHDMWERRYKKWVCKSPRKCTCWFCRYRVSYVGKWKK